MYVAPCEAGHVGIAVPPANEVAVVWRFAVEVRVAELDEGEEEGEDVLPALCTSTA